MIHGDVEEALYLVSVQVHCDESGDPGSAEEIGHELCSDGDTRFVLAVLACPAEVRYYSGDVMCRGALGCINHEQQLHNVVRGRISGLYEEDILTTDAVFVIDRKLSVGKVLDFHVP